MSTVYQAHQYAIKSRFKKFQFRIIEKYEKIQKTKVKKTSNLCDRFESAMVFLILVLFFILVILFIQYMITIANPPILIGGEMAEKDRNSAVL